MERYLKMTLLLVALSMAGCAAGPTRDAQLADRGFSAMQAGDLQTAEALLDEALAENPDNPYAAFHLATIYQQTDRPQMARILYLRVISGEADYKQAPAYRKRPEEVERLVRLSRDNLDLIAREEARREREAALRAALEAELAREPEPEPEPEPVPAVGYRVQIGAFESPANAERLSNQVMVRHANLLGGKEAWLAQSDGLTKVQIGPYLDMKEASDACRTLKRLGIDCFPRSGDL